MRRMQRRAGKDEKWGSGISYDRQEKERKSCGD